MILLNYSVILFTVLFYFFCYWFVYSRGRFVLIKIYLGLISGTKRIIFDLTRDLVFRYVRPWKANALVKQLTVIKWTIRVYRCIRTELFGVCLNLRANNFIRVVRVQRPHCFQIKTQMKNWVNVLVVAQLLWISVKHKTIADIYFPRRHTLTGFVKTMATSTLSTPCIGKQYPWHLRRWH